MLAEHEIEEVSENCTDEFGEGDWSSFVGPPAEAMSSRRYESGVLGRFSSSEATRDSPENRAVISGVQARTVFFVSLRG